MSPSTPSAPIPIALLGKNFGFSFWILLPLAGCSPPFWGILLGFPVLRLRGDYLAIVTLAFGEIIRLVLINWVAVTNGYAGIGGIPRPTFFGIPFNAERRRLRGRRSGSNSRPIHRTIFLYYLILALALAHRLRHRAAAAAAGRARLGGACAKTKSPAARSASTRPTPSSPPSRSARCSRGFAGSFFAARQGFISPEVVHLPGIRDDPRDRGARRHGQPDRRRASPPSP